MGTTADKLNYLNSTKSAIKTAIQGKGVSVSDSDTFRSYAQKIASIETKPTLSGNASAAQVLSGMTFYSNSYTKQTGTMPTYSGATNYGYISSTSPAYTIPAGYHDGTTKVSVADGYACLPGVSVWDNDPSDFPPLANIGWVGLPYALAYASRADVYDAWKGQTLPIVVSSTTCTARLVSDNYNGTSGLVFYVTGLPTQYALFSGSSTSGGWGSSSFRSTLNTTIHNTLPNNVKSLLQTNTVPYGTGGGDRVTTIGTSQDKLFVPSLKELKNNSNYLYNTTTYTNWQPAEGTQFKWFAEDVNRIKPSSRTMTRSVPQSNRYCFIEANSTDANVIWLTTAETVAFCFVI